LKHIEAQPKLYEALNKKNHIIWPILFIIKLYKSVANVPKFSFYLAVITSTVVQLCLTPFYTMAPSQYCFLHNYMKRIFRFVCLFVVFSLCLNQYIKFNLMLKRKNGILINIKLINCTTSMDKQRLTRVLCVRKVCSSNPGLVK